MALFFLLADRPTKTTTDQDESDLLRACNRIANGLVGRAIDGGVRCGCEFLRAFWRRAFRRFSSCAFRTHPLNVEDHIIAVQAVSFVIKLDMSSFTAHQNLLLENAAEKIRPSSSIKAAFVHCGFDCGFWRRRLWLRLRLRLRLLLKRSANLPDKLEAGIPVVFETATIQPGSGDARIALELFEGDRDKIHGIADVGAFVHRVHQV